MQCLLGCVALLLGAAAPALGYRADDVVTIDVHSRGTASFSKQHSSGGAPAAAAAAAAPLGAAQGYPAEGLARDSPAPPPAAAAVAASKAAEPVGLPEVSGEEELGQMDRFMEVSALSDEAKKGLQVAVGQVLSQNGTGCDLDITRANEPESSIVKLLDSRGCYRYLEGAGCSGLEALQEALGAQKELKRNTAGNSGSKILMATDFEHEFVVKTVEDDEAVGTRRALLELNAMVTADEGLRKKASFIAPICFFVTLQYKPTGSRWPFKRTPAPETWAVMRRSRLSKEDYKRLGVPAQASQTFDLKGPTWVKWDGKTVVDSWLGKFGKGAWKVKDKGFRQAFPGGLQLWQSAQNCPACVDFRDMLNSDTAALEAMGITDYSLLIQVYEGAQHGAADECRSVDSFPAVFKAIDPRTHKQLILAVAIIDYGATRVASKLQVLSTMIHPQDYRKTFLEMWQGFMGKTAPYFTCLR